jgi:hypothetical protein
MEALQQRNREECERRQINECQTRYAEESYRYQIHLQERQRQREIDVHQIYTAEEDQLAEVRQRQEVERERRYAEDLLQHQVLQQRVQETHQARLADELLLHNQQMEQDRIERENAHIQSQRDDERRMNEMYQAEDHDRFNANQDRRDEQEQNDLPDNQGNENAGPDPVLPIPEARRIYVEPVCRHNMGHLSIKCPKCGALHFAGEKLSKSTRNNPKFGMCCLQGQVQLDPFPDPPPTLKNLLVGLNTISRTFREKIRQYNAAFAFTSTSVKVNDSAVGGSGPYSFRIHGDLYHQMGSLLPRNDASPSYAQLYINDPQVALDARNSRNPNLNPMIMTELQAMLNDVHPYVPLYKQAYQIMMDKPLEEQANIHTRIVLQPSADHRRYNLPTADEVAAIIPGNGEEDVSEHREIILRLKAPAQGSTLKRISHLNPLYAPLHYVLLFPHGEQGWHTQIPSLPGPQGQIRSPNVTQRRYYAYRLHIRDNEPETIFRGGRLFQQYVVDAWSSIEGSELYWLRTHQKDIRADLYQGVFLQGNVPQKSYPN